MWKRAYYLTKNTAKALFNFTTTGASIVTLLVAGCTEKPDEEAPYFNLKPNQPIAGQPFVLTGCNILHLDMDTATDTSGDGDAGNDQDVTVLSNGEGYGTYHTSGKFGIRAFDPGRSTDARGTLIVQPDDKFMKLFETFPDGLESITKADWDRFVKSYLNKSTRDWLHGNHDQNEGPIFDGFEDTLTGRTVSAYGTSTQGLFLKMNLTDPNMLLGLGDTDSDGLRDIVGLLGKYDGQSTAGKISDSDLTDILLQTTGIMPKQIADTIVDQMQPNQVYSPPATSRRLDFSGLGSVLCHYAYDWNLNGVSVTVGIIYDQLPDPTQQPVIDALNQERAQNTYRPESIKVIPAGSRSSIRKAIGQELDYHKANNP